MLIMHKHAKGVAWVGWMRKIIAVQTCPLKVQRCEIAGIELNSAAVCADVATGKGFDFSSG